MESGSDSGNKRDTKGRGMLVFVLIVAVILMGSTIFVMVLDDLDVFEPPYPSESTPLALVDGAVTWTGQLDYWMSENETFDYRYLRLNWFYGPQGGCTTNELADYSLLSGGAPITVTRLFHLLSIHVTDLLGDGLFGRGDTIVFDYGEDGTLEDTVHRVALADVVSGWNQEVSFAVHGGDFYSWESDQLPADYPWWI